MATDGLPSGSEAVRSGSNVFLSASLPPVPGLMFARLPWAVCQHPGPDRNLLFHISAPSLAPGNPTGEACLGAGRPEPWPAWPKSWPLAAGARWGWAGRGKGHTVRPYSTEQGLPLQQGLQTPLAGSHPPDKALCRYFYGMWGSLEGNVPCAYNSVRMICVQIGTTQTHRTLLDFWPEVELWVNSFLLQRGTLFILL